MINQHDIEAFAEMSIAELLNQIAVLHTEINYAKDQLQPHDTGHIHTAIHVLEQLKEEYQNETNIQKTNNNTSSSIFSDTILFSKGVNRMMIEYCMYCDTQLTEGFPEFEDCTTLLCDNCGACIDIWHPTKEYEDAQIRSNKKLYD